MDRLDSMLTLVTVAEAGSLSAAARVLDTPLTTVSRKISVLEGRLKTQLLTRSSRRISLTDAGKSYVAACKRILEDVSEAGRAYDHSIFFQTSVTMLIFPSDENGAGRVT